MNAPSSIQSANLYPQVVLGILASHDARNLRTSGLDSPGWLKNEVQAPSRMAGVFQGNHLLLSSGSNPSFNSNLNPLLSERIIVENQSQVLHNRFHFQCLSMGGWVRRDPYAPNMASHQNGSSRFGPTSSNSYSLGHTITEQLLEKACNDFDLSDAMLHHKRASGTATLTTQEQIKKRRVKRVGISGSPMRRLLDEHSYAGKLMSGIAQTSATSHTHLAHSFAAAKTSSAPLERTLVQRAGAVGVDGSNRTPKNAIALPSRAPSITIARLLN